MWRVVAGGAEVLSHVDRQGHVWLDASTTILANVHLMKAGHQ